MAKIGRPPGWLISPGAPRVPVVEVASVRERQRLTLPLYGRSAINWLQEDQSSDLLAVLGEPGQVVMLPWHPEGDRIEARIAELARSDPLPTEHEELLVELRSRYLRQTIDTGGRVTLSPLMVAHLELISSPSASVFVAVYSDRIEIWSQRYRLSRRHSISLHEFPEVP